MAHFGRDKPRGFVPAACPALPQTCSGGQSKSRSARGVLKGNLCRC
jgi:hypothetical protein